MTGPTPVQSSEVDSAVSGLKPASECRTQPAPDLLMCRKPNRQSLRVALVAGTLGRGGAEKQLFYMTQSLAASGVSVQVYSATHGELYEAKLAALGVPVHWFGRSGSPILRLVALTRLLRSYRPHVIQAGHTFTSLYAALAGRWLNAMSLGAQRSDFVGTRRSNGIWAYPLMRTPSAVIANSEKARQALTSGRILGPDSVRVLHNAIDLSEYAAVQADAVANRGPVAIFVARLIARKRLDRFLSSLALASRQVPAIKAIVVGDGPERERMQQLAKDLGLLSSQVEFLGERDDVSAQLRRARFLVLSSDWEGTPNVILEAMATALPVITTPVGDAAKIVANGVTGYVVDFDDSQGMADKMVQLARSPELCRRLGEAGRERVRQLYGLDGLGERLLSLYLDIARQQRNHRVLEALAAHV